MAASTLWQLSDVYSDGKTAITLVIGRHDMLQTLILLPENCSQSIDFIRNSNASLRTTKQFSNLK